MPEPTDPPTGPVPRFETEAEERAYWESHDSAGASGLVPGRGA